MVFEWNKYRTEHDPIFSKQGKAEQGVALSEHGYLLAVDRISV